MMYKKRILFVGEASFLSTGFSTIYGELLPRLAATGKFEIAEIGAYARPDDPRIESFIQGRWKFYGTMPTNEEESRAFQVPSQDPRDKGQNINQFGYQNFDKICAEFQPDILCTIRDHWMDTPALRSCFRDWMKIIWMPTVDSRPQAEEWLDDYKKCDVVLGYSDFGVHTLKQEAPSAKLFPKPFRPGVDLETFKPMDKSVIRDEFNLSKDIKVIGLVQRNQSRKLILDTIDAFALMKKKYKGNEDVDKSVLLMHTGWPDNAYSYNYPRHIMRLQTNSWLPYHYKGIQSDVLQTYMCHACGEKFVGWAMTLYGRPTEGNVIKIPCAHCGKTEATPPTTGTGFSREDLAKIYNLMDVFVQNSIAEGCALPVQESKACGVPNIVTDYSATAEKGRFPEEYCHFKELGITKENYTVNKGGITFKNKAFRHEPETACFRAVPDIEDLALQMKNLITDQDLRETMGIEARECAEEHYDWNKNWKQWEFVFDKVKSKDRSTTWESPIVLPEAVTPQEIPEGLNDDQFIEWLYVNILKYKTTDPQGAKMWQEHLDQGVTRAGLLERFIQIGNQQMDIDNVRQKIRAEVSGQAVPAQEQKMEWI